MVDATHVRRTADACTSFLDDHVEADWHVPVPDLELWVPEVVAHAAEGCLWYAIDLAAGDRELQTVEHRVKFDGEPAGIVETLRTHATVVASVIEVASPSARGFHPLGRADASGFAAMACDEMLIHTDDAARGLGVEFDPPDDLTDPILRRLFPWITEPDDPWNRLRWANGRIAFDGQPRLSPWAWHCAPLSEWNGQIPTGPS